MAVKPFHANSMKLLRANVKERLTSGVGTMWKKEFS